MCMANRHKKNLIWVLLLLLLFQSVALAAMPCRHASTKAGEQQHSYCHMANLPQAADNSSDGQLLDCQKCALALLLLADDNQHPLVKLTPAQANDFQSNIFPHYYSHSQSRLTRPPQLIFF